MTNRHTGRLDGNRGMRRKALVMAIGGTLALAFGGTTYAQAVNGTIHGSVPVASNEAIRITGGAGYNRTIPVDASGQYSVTLPVGTYAVSLLHNGEVVQTQSNVTPVAAGGVTVNFTSGGVNAAELSAVTVSASQIPAIDVTTTNQVTTITAKQLEQLPLARSAEGIALLSPGVQPGGIHVFGSPLGTPTIDFGGATTAENAYYLDGMNSTYQLINQGGIALPYGAIAQQQTYISGYGAKYGRSIGGVISQVGKSGSNEWHFGVRALWKPSSWRADKHNTYWANPRSKNPDRQPGDLLVYDQADKLMSHTYDVYVSGPIIKDKLFFYVALEKEQIRSKTVGSVIGQTMTHSTTHQPKTYVKLNWNINSRNFLTLTAVQNQNKNWGSTYYYDYKTFQNTGFRSRTRTSKISFITWVANYTSYITDDLTLHAMFGKQHGEFWYHQPAYPGFDPSMAYVFSASEQNPDYIPNGPVSGLNGTSLQLFNAHQSRIMNYRLSLEYELGNHDITVGIDNIQAWDNNDGSLHSGPGYAWLYGHTDPDKPIFPGTPGVAPYVAPPNSNAAGAEGYWVAKQHVLNVASVLDSQRAQYIVDHWQVTPRLLLNLGIRNSQFTNYNAAGVPYIRLTKPQWAPRIGFSWNVFGDSTLKVFGNAGRYFLAMPNKSALWVGSKQTLVNYYGTYTGIDQTSGAPTGFKPLPQTPGTGVSPNNQYGNNVQDPRFVAAQNLQAEYSDNYVLGLKKQFDMLGTQWVFGATATYQDLKRVVNNYGDIHRECEAALRQGLDFMTPENCTTYGSSFMLINPGETAVLRVKGPDGQVHRFNFTREDQGFERGPKRRYYALDLSLEHAWDGKWFARADYVFSRLYGNAEGPVSAVHDQSGSYDSVNAQWIFPEMQVNGNGLLPSDRRHVLKVYGAYAITPEWTLGGNLYIASGKPKICVGPFGPDQLSLHGYGSYRWCHGQPAPIGSRGSRPWQHRVDLSIDYKPAWADHKLDFNFAVFNVLNEQVPLAYYHYSGTDETPSSYFGYVQARTAPRQMRFSIAYDY